MQTAALFIDAGYLYGAGSDILASKVLPRKRLSLVDPEGFIKRLLERVQSVWDGESLRILRAYWYDGAALGLPTAEQSAIGDLPKVKLRLGRISAGGQKGVDGLIILDLITLARNGAAGVAIILSGDEDLRETVAHAQSFGTTVVVVGFPPSGRQRQSVLLLREADHVVLLDAGDIADYLHVVEVAAPSPSAGDVDAPAAGGDVEATTSMEEVLTPPVIEAGERLLEVCEEIVGDQRFSTSSGLVMNAKGGYSLSRHVDRVLIAKLVELTGTFPVDTELIRRARRLCVRLATGDGSKLSPGELAFGYPLAESSSGDQDPTVPTLSAK